MIPLPENPTVVVLLDSKGQPAQIATNVSPELTVMTTSSMPFFEAASAGKAFRLLPPVTRNTEPMGPGLKSSHELAFDLLSQSDRPAVVPVRGFDMPTMTTAYPAKTEPLKVEGVDCVAILASSMVIDHS